jgi:hypothetical protein
MAGTRKIQNVNNLILIIMCSPSGCYYYCCYYYITTLKFTIIPCLQYTTNQYSFAAFHAELACV